MRKPVELIAGWMITTVFLVMMAVVIKPLMPALFLAWFFVTTAVTVDLTRTARDRRRAVRALKAAMANPGMNRIVVLPPSPPAITLDESSGMILLPEGDRDPRWGAARERLHQLPQRLQRSRHLHVDRDLRPLTDCPAGHYDYHELHGSSLERIVRRCAWCPPAVSMWTEGPVGDEGSKR